MARYVFFLPLSSDAKAVTAAKKKVQSLGATVVRSAAGQMLVDASPTCVAQVAEALPSWKYSAEQKSARIPERSTRPLQRARVAAAKG